MLNLYENITPNHTATHYIFSAFSSYLTMLNSFKLKEITPNNYTIDNLFIRCKLDETLTLSNYKNVTYIVNTEDEICYFVNSAQVKSGYVYYSLSVDNWGTYLHKASLKDILIKRCNRKLSENGILDKIANVNELYSEKLVKIMDEEGNYLDTFEGGKMVVVVVLKISEKIRMLGFYLNQAYITASGHSIAPQDIQQYVSGIHKAKTGVDNEADAVLISTYLVPFVFLSSSYGAGSSYIKSSIGGDAQLNCIDIYPNEKQIYLESSNELYNELVTIGTYNVLVPLLKRTYNEETIIHNYYLRILITLNEIKVMLLIANHTEDITASFTFVATTYGENYKSTDKISSALGYFKGIAQLGVGLFGGSPLSIVKGISSITSQVISDITPYPTSMIGGGDAFSNMDYTGSSYKSAIRTIRYTSLINESKRLRKLGATFNEYVDTITEIYSKELLGTGTATDDTYISADMEISNIPLDAISDITGKFSNGVNTQLL